VALVTDDADDSPRFLLSTDDRTIIVRCDEPVPVPHSPNLRVQRGRMATRWKPAWLRVRVDADGTIQAVSLSGTGVRRDGGARQDYPWLVQTWLLRDDMPNPGRSWPGRPTRRRWRSRGCTG
jgi:hypothetical protein